MKSILLITWANIKRRKTQTFLVAICIALTALMFSTLIGVFLGMEKPFETLYARLNASHILMNFDVNIHQPKEIVDWFEAQKEVEKIAQPKLRYNMRKVFIYKGEEVLNLSYIVEHTGNSKKQDELAILEGEKADFPAPGEIWIPNHYRAKATDLVVGDTMFIPTQNGLFPLIVSAIVVDAYYSNGLADPNPVWVGPGTLSLLFPMSELSSIHLGIRMKDAADTEQVWARFNEEYVFNGTSSRYNFFKEIFQIIYSFIASMLTFFAFLGIFITVGITASVVNSAIRTDYKMIGMLKAQGFTNLNVITVYLIQFFLITLVAVPIGLVGGYFMIQVIFDSLIASIGSVNFDFSIMEPALYTFLAFLIGILIITYLTARKAGQITPVAAIRFGGPPPKSFKLSQVNFFSLRENSKISFFLGLRFLMSDKRRTFLLFLGLVSVIFVQNLHHNGGNSVGNLRGNRAAWGLHDSDLAIFRGTSLSAFEEDTFIEEMEEDERIDKIIPNSYYLANLPAQKDKAPELFVGDVYDDDLEKLGLENIEGRHPVFEDEISLGIISSQELDKTLGDTLELFMEGQLVPFEIVGLYQSIRSIGKGFKIRLEGIQEVNPLYKMHKHSIILKDGENITEFKNDLLKRYGSIYDVRENTEMEAQLQSILNGLQNVMFLVAMLFLGVLVATVFNDTVLNIRENQKDFGIYKAIGMTPKQLQIALLFKSVLVALLALAVGIPLSLWLVPPGLSILSADAGLINVPYKINWLLTLGNIPLIILITVGSVWLASKRVLGIKPRVLVRE